MANHDTQLRDYKDCFDVPGASGKAEYRTVNLTDIRTDKLRNPRDEEAQYESSHPDMVGLMNSIRDQGYLQDEAILLHRDPDGSLDLLKGNMRYWACSHLGILSIPAKIISGLTVAQKMIRVMDHGQVSPIGPIGEYKSVRGLMEIGLGRMAITQKLGFLTKDKKPDVNKTQFYMDVACLPKDISDCWKEYQRNPESTGLPFKPTIMKIKALKAAQYDDQKEGNHSQAGPKYMEELIRIKTEGKTKKEEEKKRALTSSGIMTLAKLSNNKVLKEHYLSIAGVEGYDHVSTRAKIEFALDLCYPNDFPTDESPILQPPDIQDNEPVIQDDEPVIQDDEPKTLVEDPETLVEEPETLVEDPETQDDEPELAVVGITNNRRR